MVFSVVLKIEWDIEYAKVLCALEGVRAYEGSVLQVSSAMFTRSVAEDRYEGKEREKEGRIFLERQAGNWNKKQPGVSAWYP